MSFRYSVFDVAVLSNVAIPGLKPVEACGQAPDLQICLGLRPSELDSARTTDTSTRLIYVSSITDAAGEPAARMWEVDGGSHLHLAYYDGTEFWLDRAGTRLWVTWTEKSSLANTALYLLGPVLALVLRYRGIVCLHASAVVVDGCAIAFVGPEGAGKSTTAAAFARRGFPVLADDVVPVKEKDGLFWALPGSPQLRLWPDSVEMLFGSRESLPKLLPDWEKMRLSESDHRSTFSERPNPLTAIYCLTERRTDGGVPRIDVLNPQEALMNLVSNSYASQLIDAKLRGEELAFLGKLVSRVPLRQLTPHADGNRIDELCDFVSADLATLKGEQARSEATSASSRR